MSDIKDNPYGKYNGNELDYVLEVLDSENMDRKSNPYVNRFENKFSQIFKKTMSELERADICILLDENNPSSLIDEHFKNIYKNLVVEKPKLTLLILTLFLLSFTFN